MEILVLDDPGAAAAERLAAAVDAGGHIALTGGSTPRGAYERLAGMDLDWSACTLWFGDERCVAPEDERSNYRTVREALLDRLSATRPDVKRIPGELGPRAGADRYERELRSAFAGKLPELDLVLLGLGPDAHCASLFPDNDALNERRRAVVGVERPGLDPLVARVTLTLPVLNGARDVVFLAAGEEKAAAVERAFFGPRSNAAPASMVRPPRGRLTVLLDAAAGGERARAAASQP